MKIADLPVASKNRIKAARAKSSAIILAGIEEYEKLMAERFGKEGDTYLTQRIVKLEKGAYVNGCLHLFRVIATEVLSSTVDVDDYLKFLSSDVIPKVLQSLSIPKPVEDYAATRLRRQLHYWEEKAWEKLADTAVLAADAPEGTASKIWPDEANRKIIQFIKAIDNKTSQLDICRRLDASKFPLPANSNWGSGTKWSECFKGKSKGAVKKWISQAKKSS